MTYGALFSTKLVTQGDYEKAIDYLNQSLKIAKGQTSEELRDQGVGLMAAVR